MIIKDKFNKGLSLIEILVVIAIFAILGMIVATSLMLTIQGTKKSESLIKLRENLNYSLSVVERNIRNANAILDCTNSDPTTITYLDQHGVASSFSCINTGGANSYIASGSARLTSNSIKVIDCAFTCNQSDLSDIPSIIINVTVQDATSSGTQTSSVTTESQIFLRN